MMHKINFVLIVCISSCLINNIYAKVLIFTYSYNRPDFIEIQHKTFQKFLEDEYELVVFSDARTQEGHDEIAAMCQKYNIRCVRIPQEIHDWPYLERTPGTPFANYQNAASRNCNVVQYSLDNLGFKHDDILVLIDSDMFLMNQFSIRKYLEGDDIGAYLRACNDSKPCKTDHPGKDPIKYLWIGLVFLDMKKLPNKETMNFNCGRVDGIFVDSGGYSYTYLKNNPQVKVRNFNRKRAYYEVICPSCRTLNERFITCTHNTQKLQKWGLSVEDIDIIQQIPIDKGRAKNNFELYLDGIFLHYGSASNYSKQSEEFHQQKSEIFFDLLMNKRG